MQRFEAYAAANPKGITPDSINLNRQVVRTLAGFLPKDFAASKLTKREVRAWQDAMRLMPIKAADSREFRGKSIVETIKLNETIRKPVLSKASVNKYLNSLSAFCDWLVNRDELDRNPVTGLRDRLDKTVRKVLPYSSEELQTLFTSPLFTGFERQGFEHRPGTERASDWQRWLPLIALYTGARMSEIVQLLVADIRQESGHWCIHLTTEGGHGKSLKTGSSRRIIPVHPQLQALGFLVFVEEVKASGEARLFSALIADTRGQFGGKPSKWFGTYFRKIELKLDKSAQPHGSSMVPWRGLCFRNLVQ